MDGEQAAARIQAIQRGRLARFSVNRRRRSLVRREATARWEREQAAIKIQAACRGTRGRAETAQCRERRAAAAKIQARMRGERVRKQMNRAAGGFPLDRADIKKGLHTLGRNPYDTRQCYIGLMVANLGVSSIDAIADFPLLQIVDVSGNSISNIKPLSRLPFLHDLNISHNLLTRAVDYKLFEGEDFTWRASEEWLQDWRCCVVRCWSMLHFANLSFNSIDTMGDLSHHRSLQELDLGHNAIESIRGLSALRFLRVLKLNHNRIQEIEGLDDLPLVELHLDHNMINTVQNVGSDKLSRLRVLRLGHNSITTLAGLAGCLTLASLDIQFNRISAVRQVEFLQNCSYLHTLVLEGNPVDNLMAYRSRVIFRLQGLMLLDGNKIPPEEKVKAINLMGEDDSDLPHRREVFHEHFPDKEFIDTLPPFHESEGPPIASDGGNAAHDVSEGDASAQHRCPVTPRACQARSPSPPGYD